MDSERRIDSSHTFGSNSTWSFLAVRVAPQVAGRVVSALGGEEQRSSALAARFVVVEVLFAVFFSANPPSRPLLAPCG